MSVYEDIRESLLREFQRRKSLNARYSLRAFAKSIDISVSRLSEILSGKRNPSQVQLEKINNLLGASWRLQLSNTSAFEKKASFTADQFEMISNWIYLSVLSFLKAKNRGYSSHELAKLFDVENEEMDAKLNMLLRLGLVEFQSPLWHWTIGPEKTSDQIPSEAIQKYHGGILQEARTRITKIPVEERDYSSLIITIDPEKLALAKSEIKNFRRKLGSLLEEGDRSRVYALNIQLFPLSNLAVDEPSEGTDGLKK